MHDRQDSPFRNEGFTVPRVASRSRVFSVLSCSRGRHFSGETYACKRQKERASSCPYISSHQWGFCASVVIETGVPTLSSDSNHPRIPARCHVDLERGNPCAYTGNRGPQTASFPSFFIVRCPCGTTESCTLPKTIYRCRGNDIPYSTVRDYSNVGTF